MSLDFGADKHPLTFYPTVLMAYPGRIGPRSTAVLEELAAVIRAIAYPGIQFAGWDVIDFRMVLLVENAMNYSAVDSTPSTSARLFDFFPPFEDISPVAPYTATRMGNADRTDADGGFDAEEFGPRWWPAPESNPQ